MNSSFSFNFNRKIELGLVQYIDARKDQEITGGLIGDIKGRKGDEISFYIHSFLPFPNLASDKRNFSDLPKFWFEVLEEWRLFYYPKFKFIGFLHTHPESSSRLSEQDNLFANLLVNNYGTIIFIIISENKSLRCYLLGNKTLSLIRGISNFYKCLIR